MNESKKKDIIYSLLNMKNYKTRLNWLGWDKGDCSLVGLIKILLIQEIEVEIKERVGGYDNDLVSLLKKIESDE
jgi:hypothetical protein